MTVTDPADCTEREPARPAGRAVPPLVSVVIPARNEARNLARVFAALPDDLHEVIVVDGHSVDGTPDAARRLRPAVRVVGQNRTGKGNALACGFAAATGDVIVMVDADGSADPDDIPRLVAALTAGADFATGSRFAPGAGHRMLGLLVSVMFGTRYSDLSCGGSAFWTRHLPVFGLTGHTGPGPAWGDGAEIETLLLLRAATAGLTVTEVPVSSRARIPGSCGRPALREGGRVLRTILTERRHG